MHASSHLTNNLKIGSMASILCWDLDVLMPFHLSIQGLFVYLESFQMISTYSIDRNFLKVQVNRIKYKRFIEFKVIIQVYIGMHVFT